MANEIVWYDSSETGAPTLNNAAGSLIGVLDACLITGFRLQTLTSVVVASNVATATLAGHGYSDARMLDIAGAGTGAINGRKKITVTGAGTFTFPAPGVSDGTISGTITAKRSPLGWTKPASGTNKAIYQRSDVTATGMLLRLDDTSTGSTLNYARALMLESYTDIDTYVATASGPSGGQYWPRGYNNDTVAKVWVLVGDGKTFYFFSDIGNGASSGSSFTLASAGLQVCGFGDMVSYRSADAYKCICAGPAAHGGGVLGLGGSAVFQPHSNVNNSGSLHIARAASQLSGSGLQVGMVGYSNSSTGTTMGSIGPVYPSPVDNGMDIQYPVRVVENSSAFSYPIRGYLRGVYHPLMNLGRTYHLSRFANLTGSDRELLCVAVSNSSTGGSMLLDITGPWES